MESAVLAAALAAVLGAAGPADAGRDAPAANEALVRAAVARMFAAREPALAARYVAEDYREHNPRLAGGRAGVVAYLERMREAFPDAYGAEITQALAQGDRVMVFIRWRGVQRGPFLGVAPTQPPREITFTTADLWRVREGRLAEHWDVVDRMDRDLALGLVTRPR